MNSDDRILNRAIGKLRRDMGFEALTPEAAKEAFEAAPSVPLSEKRVQEIVKAAAI